MGYNFHSREVRELAEQTGMGELQAYRHLQQRKALAKIAQVERRKNSRAFFNHWRAGD
jgi:hypothetical protein